MAPRSRRWASCLLPGSSVAWTAAMLAGWQTAVPATLWLTHVPTVGPWSLESEALASPTHTAASTASTATGRASSRSLCTLPPSPHGRYLLSSSFSLAGWGNFHLVFILSNLKLFLNIIFCVNPTDPKSSLYSGPFAKALTLPESSCLSLLGRLKSLGS